MNVIKCAELALNHCSGPPGYLCGKLLSSTDLKLGLRENYADGRKCGFKPGESNKTWTLPPMKTVRVSVYVMIAELVLVTRRQERTILILYMTVLSARMPV